ncbi:DUF4190 domain-containing protein [Corynebacterium appendicis]|uniref:DUF4190 domain-containing protein n=1 Tax=Corynebacterium appendicis TaxID=163202 RepID=UPI0023575F98|nr:DUF4190 domain-containing protein [Corynebacterium appendicis]
MVHPNPYGAGYPRSPRDPLNEPHGGYSHERAGQFDGYGQPFTDGPVDAYGRYNPHGPNSYLPSGYANHGNGQPRTNGFAIASLVMGIATALTSWWFIILGSMTAIAGIVFGAIGISQNRRGLRRGGLAPAIIGIVLNVCALVVAVLVSVLLVSMLYDDPSSYTDFDYPAPAGPGEVNEQIFERPNDRFTENT